MSKFTVNDNVSVYSSDTPSECWNAQLSGRLRGNAVTAEVSVAQSHFTPRYCHHLALPQIIKKKEKIVMSLWVSQFLQVLKP